MLLLITFIAGLAALVIGAELLVRGASKLAQAFGISPLIVGLTVVAFGTSAPEMAVGVQSAMAGQVDIALGNVVGSSILNVLLILGLAALVSPVLVSRQIVRQEVPLALGASVLLLVLALDGAISATEGALLFGLLLLYLGRLVWQTKSSRAIDAHAAEDIDAASYKAPESRWDRPRWVQILLVLGGLALLVLGSDWLVDASVQFARALGVSELVVGLTIVAAGTSAPELATTLIAGLRGQRDLAVGNVMGSNLFNLLGVLGISAMVAPDGLAVPDAVLHFDLPVMIATAAVCLPIFFTGGGVSRWEGALFVGYYIAYTVYLLLEAQHNDALPIYRWVLVTVVLPATMLTLAAGSWREWRRRRK